MFRKFLVVIALAFMFHPSAAEAVFLDTGYEDWPGISGLLDSDPLPDWTYSWSITSFNLTSGATLEFFFNDVDMSDGVTGENVTISLDGVSYGTFYNNPGTNNTDPYGDTLYSFSLSVAEADFESYIQDGILDVLLDVSSGAAGMETVNYYTLTQAARLINDTDGLPPSEPQVRFTASFAGASATANPEPATMLLVGSGIAGLAAVRRRKQAA